MATNNNWRVIYLNSLVNITIIDAYTAKEITFTAWLQCFKLFLSMLNVQFLCLILLHYNGTLLLINCSSTFFFFFGVSFAAVLYCFICTKIDYKYIIIIIIYLHFNMCVYGYRHIYEMGFRRKWNIKESSVSFVISCKDLSWIYIHK